MARWLRLHAFTAGGPGWIPGQETKIPQAKRGVQKKKRCFRCSTCDRQSGNVVEMHQAPLNQILCRWGPAIRVYTSPLGDSDALESLRTAVFDFEN